MDPTQFYTAARTAAEQAEARERRRARVISHARLAIFLATVWALYVGAQPRVDRSLLVSGAIVALGTFAVLVVVHARARRRLEDAMAYARACTYALARIRREWTSLPEPPAVALDESQSVLANDLAITGHAGLATLLNVTTPALGGARVLRWLLSDPPPVRTIGDRAASVSALRSQPELLLGVAAGTLHRRQALATAISQFERWGSGVPEAAVVFRARVTAWISSAVVLGLLLAASRGAIALALLALALQLALAGLARRRLEADLRGVDDAFTQSAAVARALGGAESLRDVPGQVGDVATRLHQDGALRAMHSLRRLLDWNNVRYSPMGLWMLNAVAGLDVHLWRGIVRWRARHGGTLPVWIDATADIEAHVALATLGFENPGWCMPVVHDDDARPAVAAAAVGHPLVDPARRVDNDLALERVGDLLIVSGSNMSGKTTYLRAAGLNALLAQAGGPVCASAFALRHCRVRTSVRVQDDLTAGVSLFYAEARRLHDVVTDARVAGAPPVFFLFDEILHGTNAADRRTATQLVLAHLARAGAFGIVTTHDPLIAPAGDTRARQVHFSEQLSTGADTALVFDYQLRDGPATSANALAILRSLGL